MIALRISFSQPLSYLQITSSKTAPKSNAALLGGDDGNDPRGRGLAALARGEHDGACRDRAHQGGSSDERDLEGGGSLVRKVA